MTISGLEKICRNYARKIETDLTIFKAPEEWDFRQVTEAELPLVIAYEYAREHKGLRQRVTKILESVVHGESIRSHLLKRADESDKKVATGIFESVSSALTFNHHWIVFDHPLFPLPWLAFEREDALASAKDLQKFKPRAVRIYTNDNQNGTTLKQVPRPYSMWINFRSATKDQIVSDFKKWVSDEAENHHRKLSGAGSQPPFCKLKWLAALRLQKAGLSFRKAYNELIRKFPRLSKDNAKVIPFFFDQPSWTRAISNAKNEVRSIA